MAYSPTLPDKAADGPTSSPPRRRSRLVVARFIVSVAAPPAVIVAPAAILLVSLEFYENYNPFLILAFPLTLALACLSIGLWSAGIITACVAIWEIYRSHGAQKGMVSALAAITISSVPIVAFILP